MQNLQEKVRQDPSLEKAEVEKPEKIVVGGRIKIHTNVFDFPERVQVEAVKVTPKMETAGMQMKEAVKKLDYVEVERMVASNCFSAKELSDYLVVVRQRYLSPEMDEYHKLFMGRLNIAVFLDKKIHQLQNIGKLK